MSAYDGVVKVTHREYDWQYKNAAGALLNQGYVVEMPDGQLGILMGHDHINAAVPAGDNMKVAVLRNGIVDAPAAPTWAGTAGDLVYWRGTMPGKGIVVLSGDATEADKLFGILVEDKGTTDTVVKASFNDRAAIAQALTAGLYATPPILLVKAAAATAGTFVFSAPIPAGVSVIGAQVVPRKNTGDTITLTAGSGATANGFIASVNIKGASLGVRLEGNGSFLSAGGGKPFASEGTVTVTLTAAATGSVDTEADVYFLLAPTASIIVTAD